MKRFYLLGAGCLLALSGCNAANVQPQPTEPQPQIAAVQPAQVAAVSEEEMQEFEKLNGRITLMQEQFMELKMQNTSVAERVQLLLTQFQLLAQEVKRASAKMPSMAQGADTAMVPRDNVSELMQRLDQQLMELQQIAPDLGGGNAFQLATCYTAKGQWVLIRYNRFSGESWISANGSWQALTEEQSPSISSYEVQLLRANGDVKGYVAARIDQNTGDSWWLNRDTWVKYQQ